jgi:hypothetical protein
MMRIREVFHDGNDIIVMILHIFHSVGSILYDESSDVLKFAVGVPE